jgi:Tol biopolymer transport system component
MGEVYRARDTRLGREVAVKVLPENLAGDSGRLARFEQEARAASALNHPNVVTLHDIGAEGEIHYLAMELVDGPTLRELLDEGPMPIRRLLEIAAPVAEALAKAHAAGIVHRDLKPENVMVSRDGYAKVLDFGLAKLVELPSEEVSNDPTMAGATTPGAVIGTVGYMSPEQASGKKVDFRTDLFSFGTILYEMATGRRAFRRPTSAETLVAVLRDEPEPITVPGSVPFPAPLRWAIERCLAKDPEDRYASTRDLARDLATLRDRLSETTLSGETAAAGLEPAAPISPRFQRLSFRRGTILSARFAPDGQTVLYGAAWDGLATRLFSTRPESPESSPLTLPECELLSISKKGLMAISLDRHWAGRFMWTGTLAQVPLVGGAPREVLEDVQWADWAPDGAGLAIIRHVAGKTRLEYPVDNVLYETAGWLSHPRVSPDGKRVAFLDHPVQGDDAGSVVTVDRGGKAASHSTRWITAYGLAWRPDGREIWFTGTRVGVARAIWSVSLSGRERLLLQTPNELTIQDVSENGRVLATSDNGKVGLVGLPPGEQKERDLSLLDWSSVKDLSRDGKTILFDEAGEGGGALGSVHVRRTDGSPAVHLGHGFSYRLSPDGKWVTSVAPTEPRRVVLLPVRAGSPREIEHPGITPHVPMWTNDGKRLLLAGNEAGRARRLYLLGLDGSAPRPITPEGIASGFFPISPDGKLVAAQGPDEAFALYPIDGGGEPVPVPGLDPEDRPIRWTADGRALFAFRRGALPCEVFRFDLETGDKTPVRELMPPDPSGVVEITSVLVTPDASAYAYSYHRILSDLLLVEGLK